MAVKHGRAHPWEPASGKQTGDRYLAQLWRARLHDRAKAKHIILAIVGFFGLRKLFRVDGQGQHGAVP